MSKYKYWTGVGSREVTPEIKELQISVGERMAKLGYILLSGGAAGSDDNFHEGVCNIDPSLAEIYLPWGCFRRDERTFSTIGSVFIVPDNKDFDIARQYFLDNGIISWFDNMKQGAQKLHGRNYFQVFGESIGDYPVSSVVIYAAPENEKGEVKGGTKSAVMIARKEKLPTYNLMIPEQRDKFLYFLSKKEKQ